LKKSNPCRDAIAVEWRLQDRQAIGDDDRREDGKPALLGA
jgi:hypothetical protein